jgi:putative toxin-antitoxin system antitoxin component (TIGR02293 family)
MIFLSKSRESQVAVAVEAEQLSTLRSHAIRDRLTVAHQIRDGIRVQTSPLSVRVENVDLVPLVTVGLMSAAEWQNVAQTGKVEAHLAELLLRYIRVYTLAVETFGVANGRTWITEPNSALGDDCPVQLLASEDGGRAVETLLGRIGYGIAS